MQHVVLSKHRHTLSLSIFFLATFLGAPRGSTLRAQQTTLPDAPPAPTQTADAAPISTSATTDLDAPQPQQAQSGDQAPKQTHRILGILPNFRAVSADQKLPPQSVKEKFITASEDSFDYSALFVPLALAGYNLERNNDPEFGGGGVGYGRYLWHSVVDQTSENYFVEFIGPATTHEDSRYYTLGHGGFFKRTGYALSRAVITRSDSGNKVFNISEVVGSGASAGLSNLYYPTAQRSLGNTGSQWGISVGIDAASFILKEFWPDINHALFHGNPPSADAKP
jgi:hypothetical protein